MEIKGGGHSHPVATDYFFVHFLMVGEHEKNQPRVWIGFATSFCHLVLQHV